MRRPAALLFASAMSSAALAAPAAASSIGGAFLEQDSSARGTGLAGQMVALSDGSDANRWNPSGLLLLPHREISVAYADLYGLDLVQHATAQFGWPVLERDFSLGNGEVRERKLPPPAVRAFGLFLTNVNADAGSASYRETEIGASYAWRLPARARGGVSLRLLSVSSDLDGVEATGRSFDVGVQREFGTFRAAALVRDLVSSTDWKRGTDESMPKRLHLGLAWFMRSNLRATTEGSWIASEGTRSRLGGGVEWDVAAPLQLRGGARSSTDTAGSEIEYAAGASFLWKDLRIDYGFLENGNDLGTTHRWSASFGL